MLLFKRHAKEEEIKEREEGEEKNALKRPSPITLRKDVTPLGAYEKLAKELEFMPAQLLEEQLLRFLAESQIPIYDCDEVDAYLTQVAKKNNKFWIWKPLREKDKPNGWLWGGHNNDGASAMRGHGSYRDEWEYRPYAKAVPIHILRRVKKIQDKFGDAVKFFVSDYADPRPDPFIMTTALDVKRIIFGVWDEPGFSSEEKNLE